MAQSAGRRYRRPVLASVAIALALVVPGVPVSAKAGGFSSTPTFVNLGPLPSGTEGQTAIELTNNTSLTFTTLDVTFVTVNSFGSPRSPARATCPLHRATRAA